MNNLLARIIDAHGGMDFWNRYKKVEATIVVSVSRRPSRQECDE